MGALTQNLYTMIVTVGDAHHHGDAAQLRAALTGLGPEQKRQCAFSARRLTSVAFCPRLERLLLAG